MHSLIEQITLGIEDGGKCRSLWTERQNTNDSCKEQLIRNQNEKTQSIQLLKMRTVAVAEILIQKPESSNQQIACCK